MRFSVALAFAGLLLFGTATAQEPPSGEVRLVVSVAGSQTRFRIGELIPLRLEFSSTEPDRFEINLARYDRAGRMHYESFHVAPAAGWADPLRAYFESAGLMAAGGLTAFATLKETPSSVDLFLNEWVRFDKPGTYTITLESRRVADRKVSRLESAVAIRSNPFQLTIVPADATWQRVTLANALAILDAAPAATDHYRPTRTEELTRAIKTVRFLGTAEAVRAMAARLQRADAEFMLGLMGSPHRDEALAAVEASLAAPDVPLTSSVASLLSVLPLDPEAPAEELREQRQGLWHAARARIAQSLDAKRGKALAATIAELLSYTGPGSFDPATRARLARRLLAVFHELPDSTQAGVLQYHWDLINGAEILPLLRRLAQDGTRAAPYSRAPYDTSATAIRRWHELAPDDARPFIISEILRARPRFDSRTLGLLPDKTLPDVEHTLAQNLVAAKDGDVAAPIASLLHRYATLAVLPQVMTVAEKYLSQPACSTHPPLLAYLLRVAPEVARPLVESALSARAVPASSCGQSLLTDIGAYERHALLEELAIRSLDDPNTLLGGNAADYLREHGSPAAEEALWRRYARWTQEWTGREEEIAYRSEQKPELLGQASLGHALLRAIAGGLGWFTDESEAHRLLNMSIGPQWRAATEGYVSSAQPPWHISFTGHEPCCIMGQYSFKTVEELKHKLKQFPRGSSFYWMDPDGVARDRNSAAFAEIKAFLAEHGMELKKAN